MCLLVFFLTQGFWQRILCCTEHKTFCRLWELLLRLHERICFLFCSRSNRQIWFGPLILCSRWCFCKAWIGTEQEISQKGHLSRGKPGPFAQCDSVHTRQNITRPLHEITFNNTIPCNSTLPYKVIWQGVQGSEGHHFYSCKMKTNFWHVQWLLPKLLQPCVQPNQRPISGVD